MSFDEVFDLTAGACVCLIFYHKAGARSPVEMATRGADVDHAGSLVPPAVKRLLYPHDVEARLPRTAAKKKNKKKVRRGNFFGMSSHRFFR